jgi:hypothetical protein
MSTLGMTYQQIMDQIDSRVLEAVEASGESQSVVYSAYEEDEWGNPINNLDEIPVEGKIKFVDKEKTFESEVLDSPTWLEITVVANKMVNKTSDYQNRHFYDFDVFKVERNDGKIMTATLLMGS